jgi:hypothetical protein
MSFCGIFPELISPVGVVFSFKNQINPFQGKNIGFHGIKRLCSRIRLATVISLKDHECQ